MSLKPISWEAAKFLGLPFRRKLPHEREISHPVFKFVRKEAGWSVYLQIAPDKWRHYCDEEDFDYAGGFLITPSELYLVEYEDDQQP